MFITQTIGSRDAPKTSLTAKVITVYGSLALK
jgi:hypothetical protein